MSNTILHIDVNSAFLSWTAVKRLKEDPTTLDLRTVPSAIGGNVKTRHGIITAKSIPAARLGIKTAMPVVKALELCPDLILAKSDFETYRSYSQAFITILNKYSPIVEQVSIDEAFIDLTGAEQSIKSTIYEQIVDGTLAERDRNFGYLDKVECLNLKHSIENHASIHILDDDSVSRVDIYKLLPFPFNAAALIKDEIRDTLGFTVNVGISVNKLLAKMGSDFEKPDKIHTLYPNEIQSKMWPLPIKDLFGCGSKTAEKLQKIGIHTIGDAATINPEILIATLGINSGSYIHNAANGRNYSTVSNQIEKAKSISNEVTTSVDIDAANIDTLGLEILKKLSSQVSKRLKKHGLFASTIGFTVKTDDFKRRSIQRKLVDPINSEDRIFEISKELMYELLLGTSPMSSAFNKKITSDTIYYDSSTDLINSSKNLETFIDTTHRDLSLYNEMSGIFGTGRKIRLMNISTSNFDSGQYRQMTLEELITDQEQIEKEKKLYKQQCLKKQKENNLSKLLKEKFGDSVVKKGI